MLAATAEAGHLDVLHDLARDPLVPDNVRAQALSAIPHARLEARELIELYARAELALRKVIAWRIRELAPGPATEALLLKVLGEEDEELQIAAARTLGWVGTIAAIEPLRQCSKPALKSVVLKMAADAAIRAIKTRAEPNRGTLSLTEVDERGALSLSSERGALSVSRKEEDS